MNQNLIAGLIGLTCTYQVLAAENINLENVIVTASRVQQSRASVVGDVTVIDREAIERAGASSLTDILRAQPGVQIVANGGAGTASSIFLRGTNDQHVVTLLDGLRINSATLGTTSYESIPLSQIERIEILRGPASSLYGSDAIGGVIHIFTRKGNSEKPLINAAAGLGSYDTKTAEAGISGGYGSLRYGINISSLDTDSFSAKRIRNNAYDKDNDGYRNLSASAFLDIALKQGHSLGLQFLESKARSHFDNAYDNYGDQILQSYALTSKNQFTDFWHSTLRLGMGIDDSESHDKPNTNPASSSYNPKGISEYRTEQKQITWQNDFSLPLGTLTLAYDRLEQNVESKTNVKTKYEKERNNDSFLASYLLDHDSHSLQLSLREDHNSQFGNYTTGGAGYGYRLSPAWRVTANYGKAFKAPTFNQLYYPNFGDPNLSPEKSDNVEAGLKYTGQEWNTGLTVFENRIRNLIEFSGATTAGCTFAGFCPVNVGKAKIQGATLESSWNITDAILLSGNLTVQSPRDEQSDQLLTRRSNRYGAINLLHNWGNLQWGAEMTAASTRYNNATNTKVMQGYALMNLTANYRLNPEWKLEARANNIFDKNYVLAYTGNLANSVPYNTAGSNIFIGLRYQMKP